MFKCVAGEIITALTRQENQSYSYLDPLDTNLSVIPEMWYISFTSISATHALVLRFLTVTSVCVCMREYKIRATKGFITVHAVHNLPLAWNTPQKNAVDQLVQKVSQLMKRWRPWGKAHPEVYCVSVRWLRLSNNGCHTLGWENFSTDIIQRTRQRFKFAGSRA